MKPFISIITVTYNNQAELELTLNSILNQTYKNFEVVVIDGGSKNDPINYLLLAQKEFLKNNIALSFISEHDNGPYDAMNKGAKIARGEWINFLNSGDILFNDRVLEELSPELTPTNDIVYGKTLVKDDTNETIHPTSKISDLYCRMPFCHQSSFVKKELLRKFMFDINFKIIADRFFFLSALQSNYKFHAVNAVISVFHLGGLSSNTLKTLNEGLTLALQEYSHTKKAQYIFYYLKARTKNRIKNIICYFKKAKTNSLLT